MNTSPTDKDRDAQRITNAYHRVFSGEDWELVRRDLVDRLMLDKPGSGFDGNGKIDPYRVVFVEGSRSLLCHIDNMLKRPVKGDANLEEPQVKIKK